MSRHTISVRVGGRRMCGVRDGKDVAMLAIGKDDSGLCQTRPRGAGAGGCGSECGRLGQDCRAKRSQLLGM